MPSGITTSTGLGSVSGSRAAQVAGVPSEFLAEIRLKTQEGDVMTNLMTKMTLPANQGPNFVMETLARANVYALSQGVDMAQNQTMSFTEVVCSPGEYGGMLILTDHQIASKANIWRNAGKVLGQAFSRKEDVDSLTMLDGFANALGGTGTILTVGHIIAGGERVGLGGYVANSSAFTAGSVEPGPKPYLGVFNDAQLHAARKYLAVGAIAGATTGSHLALQSEAAAEMLREAKLGKIGDVQVYVDNNLGKDTADDAKGGIFSKAALMHVQFLGGPTTATDRDESLRATEIIITGWYANLEYNDAWGVEVLCDASLPSS